MTTSPRWTDKDRDRIEEPRDPEWDFHEFVSLLGHHPQLLRHPRHRRRARGQPSRQPGQRPRPHQLRQRRRSPGRRLRDAHDRDFWAKPNPTQAVHRAAGRLPPPRRAGRVPVDRRRPVVRRPPPRPRRAPARPHRDAAGAADAGIDARASRPRQRPSRTARSGSGPIEEDIDAALDTGQPVEIFAEDVTIGHRVDVFEPESPTGRVAQPVRAPDRRRRLSLPDGTTASIWIREPDEGWTTTTLVTELVETFEEPNDDVDDPFVPRAMRRLDDQLYRWDGWSGAVRPPGSAVDGTGGIAPAQPTVPARRLPGPVRRHLRGRARIAAAPALRSPVPDAGPLRRPLRRLPLARRQSNRSRRCRRSRRSAGSSRSPPRSSSAACPRPVPGVGDDALAIVLRSDYDVDDATVAGAGAPAVPRPGRPGPVRAARPARGRRRPGQLPAAGDPRRPRPGRPVDRSIP